VIFLRLLAAICFCATFPFSVGAQRQSGGFEESNNSGAPFRLDEHGFVAVFKTDSVSFEFPRRRAVSLRFFGSNPAVRIEGQGVLPGQTTFFLSGSTFVSRWFNRVVYKDLYPGIDLVFYQADGRLEYDFVIAPGADPNRIDLAWQGARHNLLEQRDPVAYQLSGKIRRAVSASLIESDSHLRFHLGNYDPALPLVIDPVLVYTNYLGGDRTDTPAAITVDSQGNVYLAGTTNSDNFTRTQGGPAYPPAGNLLASADGGKTFSRSAIDNSVLAMAATSSALIAGTTAGPYRSLDGGLTWQVSNNGVANFATNALLTDARFPGRVFAATDQGLFRSDDSGVTWNATGSGLPAHFAVETIIASQQQPSVVSFPGFRSNVDARKSAYQSNRPCAGERRHRSPESQQRLHQRRL
jgi:Beta-propeller repeat